MLTAAGVSAPDGNELFAWQTGLWGAYLRSLRQRQREGLDHAWVSFFTYEPAVGAAIWADWVQALPHLHWIAGKVPRAVIREGDRIGGVQFDDLIVQAYITLDGTELGDLLALGEVPYRWGWEERTTFSEPSAPVSLTDQADPLFALTQKYPVQSPTWVAVLQDGGVDNALPLIPSVHPYDPVQFQGAWAGYGTATFLNYGRLPKQQFMLNWPQQGNDYGLHLEQLIQGETARQVWAQEAIAHTQNFAHCIQAELGDRYGLSHMAFPQLPGKPGGGAFALMPYYRESRRVVGVTTVTETDILPQPHGRVAPLPTNARSEVSAIAIGNYPNDHHYPGYQLPLAPKATWWGGRRTGTPFALPYEALVPAGVDGLLVCEKNISVSHIANGATRLQPVVLNIGQAAGMAAALCVEQTCQPRALPVRSLQKALLEDAISPAAVVPLFNQLPGTALWRSSQYQYLSTPTDYPPDGIHPAPYSNNSQLSLENIPGLVEFQGQLNFQEMGENWRAKLHLRGRSPINLVTTHPAVHNALKTYRNLDYVTVWGILNPFANWCQVFQISGL
jgi:hypothetical protein